MRIILLIVLSSLASSAIAQKNDFLISMDGIGAVKIGMSQAELENLLKQKFTLKNALDSTAVSYNDTAVAKYNKVDISLFFQRQYTAENTFFMYLIGMKTNSPLCKTAMGIGIGSDKTKIISAYERYEITMGPQYDSDGEDAIKSKTKYFVTVKRDDGERQIIFYLRNNKVIGIEIVTVFSDSE